MQFNGIITGAGERGTWVRIFDPPVEGKIVRGFKQLDVGQKVSVRLLDVDIEKGSSTSNAFHKIFTR